jgi:hypothetical protein
MTTATVNPSTIADRAMLVNVTFKLFGSPFKTDKRISERVTTEEGMSRDRGKFQKEIIAKSALDGLTKFSNETRTEHYRRTLPWADDGARVLPTAGYFQYAEWMRKQEAAWPAVVDTFIYAYDDAIEASRVALGSAFSYNDYPTTRELRNKLAFRWTVRPVPTGDDFRCSLASGEVQAITANLNAQWEDTIRQGMNDVWSRLRDVVGKLAERLKLYDANNPKANPFRDTLVSNVLDVLDIVPALNLMGDSRVDDFCARIRRELTVNDAQALRDNMFTREDVAQRAEAIFNQMAAFIE